MQTAYLANFFGVLIFFAVWEAGSPRVAFADRAARWQHLMRNAGLFLLLMLLSNVLFGWLLPALVPALFATPQGLLSRWELPIVVQVIVGLLLLDLGGYGWHRACHRLPWLWRLHQVHHAEMHLDVSTAFRFHPLEPLLELSFRMLILAALGLPLWIEAVRILLSNPLAFAHHANVQFPAWLERWGRGIMVTPEAHRIHHSVAASDYNRNFGEILPWWDRLFGTWRTPAQSPPAFGLPGIDGPSSHSLPGMLLMPWRTRAGAER